MDELGWGCHLANIHKPQSFSSLEGGGSQVQQQLSSPTGTEYICPIIFSPYGSYGVCFNGNAAQMFI